jgi:hypothetical protein
MKTARVTPKASHLWIKSPTEPPQHKRKTEIAADRQEQDTHNGNRCNRARRQSLLPYSLGRYPQPAQASTQKNVSSTAHRTFLIESHVLFLTHVVTAMIVVGYSACTVQHISH